MKIVRDVVNPDLLTREQVMAHQWECMYCQIVVEVEASDIIIFDGDDRNVVTLACPNCKVNRPFHRLHKRLEEWSLFDRIFRETGR